MSIVRWRPHTDEVMATGKRESPDAALNGTRREAARAGHGRHGCRAAGFVLLLSLGTAIAAQEAPQRAGKTATLSLLTRVSSKSSDGVTFQARLVEPLMLDNDVVLAPGTVFTGRVVASRSRRLHRAGSLRLVFEPMVLPGDPRQAAEFSLVAVRDKDFKLDSEGTVRPRISGKRRVVELGASVLAGKLADDIAETAIGSLTPGKARIFGIGGGLAFYFFLRGKDVVIPAGTQIEVTVSRTVTSDK